VTTIDAAPGGGEHEWTEIRPPRRGLPRLALGEAWRRRDLGVALAQRTLKVRYRQTLLGVGWALLQPLAGLVIFTLLFGRLAKIPSDGLPYAVFVYPAICVWTYVSASVSAAAAELPQNPHLVTRVYFPRILSPAAAVVPGLLDLTVALALTAVLLVIYDVAPGPQVLLVPLGWPRPRSWRSVSARGWRQSTSNTAMVVLAAQRARLAERHHPRAPALGAVHRHKDAHPAPSRRWRSGSGHATIVNDTVADLAVGGELDLVSASRMPSASSSCNQATPARSDPCRRAAIAEPSGSCPSTCRAAPQAASAKSPRHLRSRSARDSGGSYTR
jgi:hypothetical protein